MGRMSLEGMIGDSYTIDQLHTALHFHLNTNMYPPLPQPIQDNITKLFHKYWTSDFSMDQFFKIWERTIGKTEAIHKYSFNQFFNTEIPKGGE